MDFLINFLLIFPVCFAGVFIADKVPNKNKYIFGVFMGSLIMTILMFLNK